MMAERLIESQAERDFRGTVRELIDALDDARRRRQIVAIANQESNATISNVFLVLVG